jgi:5-methyltetrahydrofolate--homocysteine methyltransferase
MTFDPNMKLTKENITSLPPLCTDGAWGTEMAKLGAQPGEMTDLWNVDQPEKVLSVAQSYVDAGCQIILTNTFNSNCVVLAKHEIAHRAAELSQAGAAISKEAAKGKAYVFGSIGPCGKMVMMGEITPDEVHAMAAEQAAALAAGGADAIVVETQSDLQEAEAAMLGAMSACDLPVGTTFTFDAGADNDRTMMGASIPEVYGLAQKVGAAFVGANCGAGIETFVNIAHQFSVCGTDIPCWVKGNAGQPELDESGNAVYTAPPSMYADVVLALLSEKAKFLGGCCGSSPAHLKAMVDALAAVSC